MGLWHMNYIIIKLFKKGVEHWIAGLGQEITPVR